MVSILVCGWKHQCHELIHPKPLPRGKLDIDHLNLAFKKYPHAFHDLGAELTINDTALLLRNFAGMWTAVIFDFSGRVNNYASVV